jgi:hypothetical protein
MTKDTQRVPKAGECSDIVGGKIMATELYAMLAPNVMIHNADIMTVCLDLPSAMAFLAVDPSAEFYMTDNP